MKIITFIVRVGGLYLLTNGIMVVIQLHRMPDFTPMPTMGGVKFPSSSGVVDIYVYAWGAIVVGLLATLFAGRLARLLTFDADSNE